MHLRPLLYWFSRVPFRLHNARRPFQRTMHVTLPPDKWQLALVHWDTIILFSNCRRKYWAWSPVLLLLHRAGITLHLKNSKLFMTETDSLVLLICPGLLKLASHTMDAIQDLNTPPAVINRKYLLDLYNAYRRLAPNFAQISFPINAGLKKG